MAASLVLFVALFALGIDNYIIAAILPQIGQDLDQTIATVGLLASAYAGLHPEARGTMLAFGSSTLYLGGVIGPAVSGRVLEAGGFGLLGPWNAVTGLLALSVALLVLPGGRIRQDPIPAVAAQQD